MSIKRLYLDEYSHYTLRYPENPKTWDIVPAHGVLYMGGQPNTSFYCQRIKVVGESVRATHLYIPDKDVKEGFFKGIEIGELAHTPAHMFDPAQMPIVRVQNDSHFAQPVSVSLIGPSAHKGPSSILRSLTDEERKSLDQMYGYQRQEPLILAPNDEAFVDGGYARREYIHTLWKTRMMDVHKPQRFTLKPWSVLVAERQRRIQEFEESNKDGKQTLSPYLAKLDTPSFTIQPPVRCEIIRIVAESNSNMDVAVTNIQVANMNHMIGVSGPIDMLYGGLDLHMGLIDCANRVSIDLENMTDEERWVEIYVEVETDFSKDDGRHPLHHK